MEYIQNISWNISIIWIISIYLEYIPNLLSMFQEEMANTLSDLAHQGMDNTIEIIKIRPGSRKAKRQKYREVNVKNNAVIQLKLFK